METSDDLEPAGFYHVAIDCPGFGNSPATATGPPDKTLRSIHAELIADIVHCLAKQYAFCIAGMGQGSGALLSVVSQQADLASFVFIMEPTQAILGKCSALLHPTLIACEKNRNKVCAKDSKELSKSVPQISAFEFSVPKSKKGSKSAFVPLAHALLEMYKEQNWRGYMGGLGASSKLPLLASAAGGLKAWQGIGPKPTVPGSDDETAERPPKGSKAAADASKGGRPGSIRVLTEHESNMYQ